MSIPRTLPEQMSELYRRLGEIERRARNRKRTGTVAEIGSGENAGKYRVQLSEQGGKPFKTGWVKPRQLGAGALTIDVLLSQGEQVDVVSENGDMTDAMIEMSAYSDQNARRNTDTPLHIKVGSATIAVKGDNVTLSVGGVSVDMTGDGGHLA